MARRIVTIFGGSGFIGRNLVKALADNGDIVRIAVRDAEKAMFLKPAGEIGQIVLWATDITKPDQVASAVSGADVVINSVGVLYESGRSTFKAIHTEAAASIATHAKQAGVKQLVHISALGADANSPSAYSRTKADGEKAVLEAFPEAIIFRPGVVFGTDDKFFNRFAALARFSPVLPVIGAPTFPQIKLFEGENPIEINPFGDGGPQFQPVYVGDVISAITSALEHADCAGKTYELGGPTVYSFKELMDLVIEQTNPGCFLVPLPYWVAKFEAWFIEKLPKPLLTRDQVTLMQQDNVVSGEIEGLEAFGIQPTPAEGVVPSYLYRFRRPIGERQLTA